LIGGLHGDNETQALVEILVPALGAPTLVLTEMSPWAANRLFGKMADTGVRLRGIDIEEAQLGLVIRELATANPDNRAAQDMLSTIKGGYRRTLAADLLPLARRLEELIRASTGGVSLATLVTRSLEVQVDRASPATSGLTASLRRERVMKDFFLAQYRDASQSGARPNVAAVFGRNHLHRGIDRRGVSTLGNFLVEFAIIEGRDAFNIALVAAGGKIAQAGVRDLDERNDDPAFALLAAVTPCRTTVFDLRPLREPLRKISATTRSSEQASLLYWADSYDAMIVYKK
jgi:hypothetical protein